MSSSFLSAAASRSSESVAQHSPQVNAVRNDVQEVQHEGLTAAATITSPDNNGTGAPDAAAGAASSPVPCIPMDTVLEQPELLHCVLDCLDESGLHAVTHTCRAWRFAALDPGLKMWRNCTLDRFQAFSGLDSPLTQAL